MRIHSVIIFHVLLFIGLTHCIGDYMSVCAQTPGHIYDLIINKKIDKAIDKRNKVSSDIRKSDMILIDLCDCILFNTPEYSAFNPEKSYEIYNNRLVPNNKEHSLIRFLNKKETSLDNIATGIEDNLYKQAFSIHTEEAYKHFLNLCPQSRWSDSAQWHCQEIAYRRAIKLGTIDDYKYFLSHYPSSEHIVEITHLVDKAIFDTLDNTIEAYHQFIEQYPQSELITEAKNRIYQLAYDNACKQHTREGYIHLLEKYPLHPMKDEIQAAIESIDYVDITQTPTQYAYDQFQTLYPGSPYLTALHDWLGHIAKSKTHLNAYKLRGYVKYLQETNKNKSQTIQFDQLGLALYTETSLNGSSTEKNYLYNPDFTLGSTIDSSGQKTFYYNNDHEVTRITKTLNDSIEKEITTFDYNSRRLTTRIDITSNGKTKTEYTYSDEVNLISTKCYNTNTPQNTTTTYYTPRGDIKLEITINGRLRHEKIFFYNEQGDVSKITTVHGTNKEDITFDYTYDDNGNWIRRIQHTGNISDTSIRIIEYYSY